MWKCEKCGNTVGCVFGTCNSCGWNNEEKRYKWKESIKKVLGLPEEECVG